MAEQDARVSLAPWIGAGALLIALVLWQSQEAATVDLHEGMQMPPRPAAPAQAPASPPHAEGPSVVEQTAEAPWLVARRSEAEAALAVDPNDLAALNTLTQLYLAEPAKAMELNHRALQVAPEDPDALTMKAALASMVGMHDRALERLDAVLAAHPNHPRALTYKGLVSLEAGRYDDAIASLQQVIAMTGDDPSLWAAISEAQRRKEGGAPAPAAPVGNGVVVAGTVTLDPAVGDFAASAVYVSLRDPAGGPPLAAVRLPPGPFPLTFAVTMNDLISMGGPPRALPPVVDLTIRMDQDGNAMTKVPGEPIVVLPGTAKGTTGIAATMR